MSALPPLKKILVIPLRYIGDTVLTVPLLRNLKAAYPQTDIDLLTSPATTSLMEACPYLRRVVPEPKGKALATWLRTEAYDAVFLLRKSASMAFACKRAGIPMIVGYDKQRFPWGYKRWGWFLTHQAKYPSLKTDTPQAISHLGLLTTAGIPVQDDHLELWTTPDDDARLQTLLDAEGIQLAPEAAPLAILHAASASHGKQVDIDKFGDSLRHLLAAGFQIVATGTQADVPLYEQLKAEGLSLTNLAGKTSLRETVALYRKAQLLLTVDSSPIHLGAAAGIPHIVGVFGPTNERQWGPHRAGIDFRPVFIDLPCRPCYAKVCSHNNCRVQLTAVQIADAVKAGLEA